MKKITISTFLVLAVNNCNTMIEKPYCIKGNNFSKKVVSRTPKERFDTCLEQLQSSYESEIIAARQELESIGWGVRFLRGADGKYMRNSQQNKPLIAKKPYWPALCVVGEFAKEDKKQDILLRIVTTWFESIAKESDYKESDEGEAVSRYISDFHNYLLNENNFQAHCLYVKSLVKSGKFDQARTVLKGIIEGPLEQADLASCLKKIQGGTETIRLLRGVGYALAGFHEESDLSKKVVCYETAINLLEPLYENNQLTESEGNYAQDALGVMYNRLSHQKLLLNPIDTETFEQMVQKAAEYGDKDACFVMDMKRLQSKTLNPQDIHKVLDSLEKLVDKGSMAARIYLGRYYVGQVALADGSVSPFDGFKAEAYVKDLVEKDPNAALVMSFVFKDRQDYEAVINCAQNILTLDPDEEQQKQARLFLFYSYMKLEDSENAARQAEFLGEEEYKMYGFHIATCYLDLAIEDSSITNLSLCEAYAYKAIDSFEYAPLRRELSAVDKDKIQQMRVFLPNLYQHGFKDMYNRIKARLDAKGLGVNVTVNK